VAHGANPIDRTGVSVIGDATILSKNTCLHDDSSGQSASLHESVRSTRFAAMRRALLVLAVLATTITHAAADSRWTLTANETTYSYVCDGDDRVVLSGKGNSLRISGECEALEILGSNNRITIESVGAIKISGNNNDVAYERSTNGKRKPALKLKGAANSVRRD
jgi:hypothetical protein